MKNITLFLTIIFTTLLSNDLRAQDFINSLPNLLSTPKIIQNDPGFQGLDFYENTLFKPAGNYTVEVKAKVNGTEGRGMDVQMLDANGKGYRIVSSEALITNYSNLFVPSPIDLNDNTTETTLRYVMTDSLLHIYKNNSSTPITPSPIVRANGLKSIWSEDFSNGFDKADRWVKTGDITATPVTDIVYYTNATTSVTAESNIEAVLIETKTTAANMILTYPVTPGTYKLSIKYHAFVQAGDGGLFSIKNLGLRVYNHGTTQQYGSTAYLNGHTGNITSVPRWNTNVSEIVIPDTCSSIDIMLRKENPCKIYLDNFELVKTSDRSVDILLGKHSQSEEKGIYSNFNLLRNLNPGFQKYQVNDSNKVHVEWVSNAPENIKYMFTKKKIPAFSSLQEDSMLCEIKLESLALDQYVSMRVPANTMKADTKYRLRFSFGCAGGQNWKNFDFFVAENPDGSGGALVSKSLLSVSGNWTLDKTADFKFKCIDPSKDYYLVFRPNASGKIGISVDRFLLEEDTSLPLNTLRVGKLFYFGAADIEIKSIKYADGAYIPGATSVKNTISEKGVYYSYGKIYSNTMANSEVKIYTIAGSMVLMKQLSGLSSVDVQLKKGVYLLKSNSSVQKFIVD